MLRVIVLRLVLAAPLCHVAHVPGQSTQPQSGAEPATAPSTPGVDGAANQQRLLQIFAPILLNPSEDISASTRRDAAAEILNMDIPEAIETLRQAIQSRRSTVAMAAITAIQSHTHPPSALLDHCVAALESASTDVLPALSAALGRYGDSAATKVGGLLTRSSATTRLNAATALGSFRTREAAAALMRVVDEQLAAGSTNGPEPNGDVRRAAIASLERMTGLAYGQDLAAWKSWWARAADESPEEWYRLISESLANRAASLQRQLQDQKAAQERTSRELFAAYRDLFPALPIDEQIRRIPKLLDDPLPTVRQFGMSRVSVLARDSVRMPPEIIAQVREALGDESPDMRRAAAELLDELNADNAAEAIAAQLAIEKSPSVISTLLQVLGRRPTAAAVEPVLGLLASSSAIDVAAESLWQMMLLSAIAPEVMPQVRQRVMIAAREHASPATMRLAALVCEDRDLAELTTSLDGDDHALRAAVAEGFWKRGLRQPLLDRADDDNIYPFAIRALADGPADLASFSLLAGMRPTAAHQRLWNEMIVRLASRLAPADLPAADDALRSLAYADPALRRDVLRTAAVMQRDTLPTSQRLRIIERLAPLLLELGDPSAAWTLLESLNGAAATSPALRVPRFQAAVLTGHYDRAAQIETDPAAWISLVAREMDRGESTAIRIYDEVIRRFGDVLSAEDHRRLQQIRLALPGEPTDG